VATDRDFAALVAEAERASVDGWGFSWLDGRATEERPTWGYARQLVPRVAAAHAVLDIQTGGAEILAEVLDRASARPAIVAATESWGPNLAIARRNLESRGGSVLDVSDDAPLPFRASAFDLVISRHPVVTRWDEVGRVLAPGGRYFAQHVGSGSNCELIDFMMGPQPVSGARSPAKAVADAAAQGLEVVELREESRRVEFFDVGAVVYFLRKVIWTVPDFTVARYHDRLVAMHERITADGRFVSHGRRFLIVLTKP
jgi:SAM-dependent methyltransferase